ncbi:MAG: hypothetical protein MUC87_19800 [Bacteroidia bacterium]|jgi:hypothetical protein|nr:hypothetical protein [Bacteroidia bacterium]
MSTKSQQKSQHLLAVFVSFTGLISLVFVYVYDLIHKVNYGHSVWYYIFTSLQSIYFWAPEGYSYLSFILNLIFQMLMIWGALKTLKTGKYSRLLIFSALLIFFVNALSLLPYLLHEMMNIRGITVLSLFNILVLISYVLWSYYLLKTGLRGVQFKIVSYEEDGQIKTKPEKVDMAIRLFHRILDVLLMYAVSRSVVTIYKRLLGMYYMGDNFSYTDFEVSPITLALMDIFIVIAFYILTEVVFGITPAKALSGSLVISTNGNAPSKAQLMGKTFARFIPFNGLSFFLGKDFQDKLSNTLVVKQQAQDELHK